MIAFGWSWNQKTIAQQEKIDDWMGAQRQGVKVVVLLVLLVMII